MLLVLDSDLEILVSKAHEHIIDALFCSWEALRNSHQSITITCGQQGRGSNPNLEQEKIDIPSNPTRERKYRAFPVSRLL
jgi:hypothetical protein